MVVVVRLTALGWWNQEQWPAIMDGVPPAFSARTAWVQAPVGVRFGSTAAQHRPWLPYPRSELAQARRLRPSSSQNASLVREAAQTQFNTWGRLALPLNGPHGDTSASAS